MYIKYINKFRFFYVNILRFQIEFYIDTYLHPFVLFCSVTFSIRFYNSNNLGMHLWCNSIARHLSMRIITESACGAGAAAEKAFV